MGTMAWGIMGLIDLDEVEVTPEDIEKMLSTLSEECLRHRREEGWTDRDIAAFAIAN